MPTVRAYGPRRVRTAALPAARLTEAETPTSTGAGLELARADKFETLASLGAFGVREAANWAQRLRQEGSDDADEIAALKFETQLGKWSNARLYDPDAGALVQHGEAAMLLPEQVGAEFEAYADEIGAGLSTDRQRLAFAKSRANHALNLDGALRRHVAKEITDLRATELQGLVDTSISTAISNAQDPRMVGLELQKVVDAYSTSGPKLGLGPKQVETLTRTAATKIHQGVIYQLLEDGQDTAAQVYFEETRSAIDGSAIDNITKALEEGGRRRESQRQADAIVRAGGSLKEQLEKVRAIDDPKVRDDVRVYVEHENAISKRLADEEYEQHSIEAFNILDRTKSLRSIPPAMMASFTGATKASLRAYADRLVEGKAAQTTNQGTWYRLMMSASQSPEKFAGENLLDYKGSLSDSDFQELTRVQVAVRKGGAAADDTKYAGFLTNTQIVHSALGEYGIDPAAKFGTPEADAKAHLERALSRFVDAEQAAGRKPTNSDLQQHVDALLRPSSPKIEGSWFGFLTGQPFFNVQQGKRLLEERVGDIPPAVLKQIKDALRRDGQPVTDQTVLDIWRAHKAKPNAR
jgi:hypothetical protein